MKTRTKQMKGLVILWLLLNVASAILNLVMPAAQFSIQSGITLYYSVGVLLGVAAVIVMLVLEFKILNSKVGMEEHKKLTIRNLKVIVVLDLVISLGFSVIFAFFVIIPNEVIESAFLIASQAVDPVSGIIHVIIFCRVLVSKTEFDIQEEAGMA